MEEEPQGISIFIRKEKQINYITINADNASYNAKSIGIAAGINVAEIIVYAEEALSKKRRLSKERPFGQKQFFRRF